MPPKKVTGQFQKTMIFLTPAVARNLELFAFQNQTSRAEVVREALREFLSQRGMKPDDMPTGVSVQYVYE
jgi:metal-responsive CopG/Arc/MetJ family transcriptional regulator